MALIILSVLLWAVYTDDLFLLVLRSECSMSDKALSALSRDYLICVMYCASVQMSQRDAGFFHLYDIDQDLL